MNVTFTERAVNNRTLTGLTCVFPDGSTGVTWPRPLAVGASFKCTAKLADIIRTRCAEFPAHLVRNVPTPVRSTRMKRIALAAGGVAVAALAATVIPTAAKADLSYGAGTTEISSPIVVPAGGVLSGLGVGQTVLTAAPGYSGPIVVTMPGASGVTIKNLTVDGEGRVGTGISLAAADGLDIEDVEVIGTMTTGISHVGPASGQRWTNITVHDCTGWGVKNVGDVQATYLNVKAHECGSGLWLGHDNVVATGLTAANNADGDGIYLTGNNAQITGIRATGNGGTGIHVTGTGGAGVSWLAQSDRVNDVWFSSTASGWVVTGLLAGHNPCWLGPYGPARQTPLRRDVPVQFTGVRVLPQNTVGCTQPK